MKGRLIASERDGTDRQGAAPSGLRWLRGPLLIALVAGVIWWLPHLPGVQEEPERAFLVDPAYFELSAGPAWLSGSIAESVGASLARLEPTPLRRDDEVKALTNAIESANGWVKSVDSVAKRYPNRLEVEVSLREPIALVESDEGLQLVDGEGVVVAPASESAEYLTEHDLPLVHGTRPLRNAGAGAKVRDAMVEEGLRVALEVAPFRADLARRGIALDVIDVTAKERSAGTAITDVELCTRSGLVLEWGRSRAHPKFGALEPTADAKVRGLLRVAARYPELAGIVRIRLQFSEPAVLFEEGPSLAAAPGGS